MKGKINMKKIFSILIAASQLGAAAPMVMASEADPAPNTVVYSYDYSKYTTADEVKANGITINTTSSWGTPKPSDTVGKTSGVWWIASARANAANDSEKLYTTVNFEYADADKLLSQATDDVVCVELDFGWLMKANSTYTGKYYMNFNGKKADGSTAEIAEYSFTKKGSSATKATGQFTGTTATQTIPATKVIDQRTYLKLEIDTKSKTYDAYYQQKELASGTAENKLIKIVDDAPFLDTDIVSLSNMTISMQRENSSDSFDPITMDVTILSDDNALALAKSEVALPSSTTENLSLPTAVGGTEVKWTSSNPAVISEDGTVTRPKVGAEDATVTLTAALTRGETSTTAEFTVTVPAEEFVPDESVDGIWTVDEMDYAAAADIPTTADASKFYFKPGSLVTLADKADVDTANADLNGYAYADGGKLAIVRASSEGTAQAQDTTVTKYLCSTSQHENDDLVLEFEYERIGNPNVYVSVQALNSWKGPVSFNNTKTNTINTYGQASISGKATNKVTFVFNGSKRTYDVYLNGKLYKSGISYRYSEAGTVDISKIGFTVKADTAVGDGIAINYVALLDKTAYGKWSMERENKLDIPQTVDAYTTSISLPKAGSNNNSITWTSSNPDVISNDGAVVHGDESVDVVMTAQYTSLVTGETKAAGEYTITVEPKTGITAEVTEITGQGIVKLAVANGGDKSSLDLFCVYYDSYGRLIKATVEPIEIAVGKATVERTVQAPENASLFKVMLWDSGMKPYACDSAAVETVEE